jgi:hypothetical protein
MKTAPICLCAIATLWVTTASVRAQKPQEKLHAIVRDTQKEGSRAGRVTIVWWLVPEFWRTSLAANGSLPADKIEEMVRSIQDVNIFAIIDGKVGVFGAANFLSPEEIQKTLSVTDTHNQSVAAVPESKQSKSTKAMISVMKPVFANMLGDFGKGISFFVFEGTDKSGSRRLDPTKPGSFTVKLNEEDFRWRLPLGSLLPDKICPKCHEQFRGDYAFCPFDATPLQPAAGK